VRARVKTAALIAVAFAVLGGTAAVVLVSVLGDEREPLIEVSGASAAAGKTAIEDHGCTSCHVIPGLDEPEARVGPPLDGLAERRYIAGDEPNTLDVLLRWLQDPQSVEPGTVMPDVGLTPQEARDIAAYLYSDR
jgi:cytochrome c